MKRRELLDALFYLLAFAGIQCLVTLVAVLVCQTHDFTPMVTIVVSLVSSAATIGLFAWRKWTPYDGSYINTRPWATLFWVACLAVGCMAPVSFATEELGFRLSPDEERLLGGLMNHDLGFLAVGILAPLAEEMVFRGAILRCLDNVLGARLRWAAIVVSALLFGVVHGNMAQGFGAFVLGIALGWMYLRTGSIVPGVVFHWVNNSIAVFVYRLMPGAADLTLTEFYGGDMKRVAAVLCFSLMVAGAAVYQLNLRLRR